ncbi:MAG: hypothetical protein VX346_00635 [Planctomycetota bacterium]|nr:hypothetical protein [Planctomycetota bacterium]
MNAILRNAICGIVATLGVASTLPAETPIDRWFSSNSLLYSRSLYSLGRLPLPPYFALHPPVYYGIRYRRPYGVSPFASTSLLQSPQQGYAAVPWLTEIPGNSASDRPQAHTPPAKTARTTDRSRIIINPHYRPVEKSAAEGSNPATHPPTDKSRAQLDS